MNENDLREALRTTVANSTAPPPMTSAAAVTAGRRAVRRRTAMAGAAAAVVLVVASALVVRPLLPAGGDAAMPVAAAPSAVPSPLATPRADATEPSWPAGPDGKPQEDATARSGPRYETGKRLQREILAVVPDGWTTPTGAGDDGIPLRDHQAAWEDPEWGYLASVAVARGGGTGRLLAEVHTPGHTLPSEPCALAREFWGMGGDCDVVDVAGTGVGVVVRPGADGRIDQWAAHRHPDGVVVYIAQSRTATNADSGLAPLKELPLSVAQLAALAVDERFHLQ